jgi:hypothetical protein
MVFRLFRLILFRYLPRRLFAVVSVLELAWMVRRLYRSATRTEAPPPRVVGRSGFDDDEVGSELDA